MPGYMKEFGAYVYIFHNEIKHRAMIYRIGDHYLSDFYQPSLQEGDFFIDRNVGIIQYRLKQASYYNHELKFAEE